MGQMGKVDVLYDLRQVFCFINSIFRAWLHLLGTRLAVDLKRYSKTYIAGISGLAGLARHSLGSWSFKGVHHYCTRGILILMNFRISILACCQVVPIASLISELFNMAKMAIYGRLAIGPYATNMGKWGIPEKNYIKV